MVRPALMAFGLVLLALLAGPAALVSSQAARLDAAGLYLVIGRGEDTRNIETAGARTIGLAQAPFARLIEASPKAHARIQDLGFLIIPASTLARICGVRTVREI